MLPSRVRGATASDPDLVPKRMKGIGFVNVREYVSALHGPRAWKAVLDRLGRADRAELEGLVAVGWYDTYLFARLLRQVDAVLGDGDLKLLSSIGHYEAERDFNRVLRVLMRVVSPNQVFTMQTRLWSHFQDSGTWESTRVAWGTRAVLSGWAVDDALCFELTGYLSRFLDFTGGKQVSVAHVECRAHHDPHCVFEFHYR